MNQPAFLFDTDIEDVAEERESLLSGNRIDLFENTDEACAALVAMFNRALNHVNLDAALLQAPGLRDALVECLGELCRKGVRVQVIAHEPDVAGALEALSRLCEAGITLNDARPKRNIRGWFERKFHRTMQRQLAVVDGTIAWCGPGMRSVDYCTYGPHVCVQGPVVQRLQRLFLETWHASSSHMRLPQANYFPPMLSAGMLDMGVALPADAGASPLQGGASLVEAVQRAERSVVISMERRPPRPALAKALHDATVRGVDLAMLVPPDALRSWLWRQRCHALLRSTAQVYEADGTCPFPPHCVVDGSWSCLALDGGARRHGLSVEDGTELIVHDSEFARVLGAVCRRAMLPGGKRTRAHAEGRTLANPGT